MPFQRMFAAVVMAVSATSIWLTPAAIAQSSFGGQSPFETNEDRDIFNNLPDAKRQGSVLDATNPMELMQRLREATSCLLYTSPSPRD